MKVKFVKLDSEAVTPTQAKQGDTGYDLVAISGPEFVEEGYIQYRTGIAIELPEGWGATVRALRSISKYDMVLANGVGTIDNGYRGEMFVRFKYVPHYSSKQLITYKKGDKIAQLVLEKVTPIEFVEVKTLSSSVRDIDCFGSTGN